MNLLISGYFDFRNKRKFNMPVDISVPRQSLPDTQLTIFDLD